MSEKKKLKSFGYWFGHEWRSYKRNCGREFKEPRSLTKYLFLLPKLFGHTVIYFLFFLVILLAFLFGRGVEENDPDID